MIPSPAEIQAGLERILPGVQKPGRYTGGELNQVTKDWESIRTHVALIFPDLYDLGMSNLGMAILYEELNQRPDVWAERAYAPWTDMEAAMRARRLPLYSLESKHALAEFDILGFSLPYETLYTNTLNLLDLAGIPLTTEQRTQQHPLVIAGGHAAYNPEPMHAFIDAFVIGEGEDVLSEIVDAHQAWKASGDDRQELLRSLSKIWGIYVPALYTTHYLPDGSVSHIEKLEPSAPLPVVKRIVGEAAPAAHPLHRSLYRHGAQPRAGGDHARLHAWLPLLPRRDDQPPGARAPGGRNSTSHRAGISQHRLRRSRAAFAVIIRLYPHPRAGQRGQRALCRSASLHLAAFAAHRILLRRPDGGAQGLNSRRSGFTLAPEAATERMREIINKPVATEQLLETAQAIFSHGWSNIKLYFMIGHPSETIEDVQAIIDLCKAVLAVGRKTIGKRAQVTAGVSTFVPKAHTPFQWVPCDTIEQMRSKQDLLKRQLRGPGLKLNWNQPEDTLLEAWLSRGDRRMAQVIQRAWQLGAKFDAWNDFYRYEVWLQAFAEQGLEPGFYTHRQRPVDEIFPWEHISTSVRKKFLLEDYLCSLRGETRVDCRQRCFACGILPTFANLRRQNPGDVWQCPEVKSKRIPISDLIALTE